MESEERVVRRGRPTGFVMTEKSKRAISISKTGQRHSYSTRKRISEGVKKHHRVGVPIDILMNTELSECGTYISSKGYVDVCVPNPVVGEPTYRQRYHVALIEQLLGRKLRGREEVHHWKSKMDNDILTLSLCKNRKEHVVLDKVKKRMSALLAPEIKTKETV